jgi:hypothetical protein
MKWHELTPASGLPPIYVYINEISRLARRRNLPQLRPQRAQRVHIILQIRGKAAEASVAPTENQ